MIELAQREGCVHIRDIIEGQDISKEHIEQVIVADLCKGGFIRSIRGCLGGYTLARPTDEITIGEIVRYLDTPYVPSKDPEDRPLTLVFEQVLLAVWGTLDQMTLAQVVAKQRR
jgi:Rrf2 family cysteine metabolism transcriptional repressor